MDTHKIKDGQTPDFCWDRSLTAGQIRAKLTSARDSSWIRLAAWIMREARPADVWEFLTPREVNERLDELTPLLHRRADLWRYLMGTWHEMGKL